MQGRPTGHQIDPLAIIVGLEEQVNDNAQRIDNALKNLVDLAKAVRSLVGKVEQMQVTLEERAVMPELVMGPDGEIHSETIAAIQLEHSALLQRIDDLENRALPSTPDYIPEFQRTEADIEALRLQVSSAVKRQQEQENTLREFEQLAPKLNQKLTEVARKYPEGSLAKVEDIERLGAAIDKLNKEQGKVEERFKEFAQLRDSSALLTILKTEHSAVLRRIENLEAAGPGTGEVSPIFDEVRQRLENLAAEQSQLKEQLAGASGQAAELPDVTPLIEAAVSPLRTQISQLASGPQVQSEVTRQIEAALAPVRSRLEQLADAQPELPDTGPQIEAAMAPLRQQLAALESREPAQSDASGKALEKLEATLAGLARDRDALLDQLAEQSQLIEHHKTELGTLHDAFDGVKKAAAGSGKPSPELIEAAAAAKHLQGVVEKLSQEHAQLGEQVKGIKSLESKVAELEQRAAPDNSTELKALNDTVLELQEQQSQSAELLAKLQAIEIPQPIDYSRDFSNLREEIGALNALQQPLLERIVELEGRELPAPADFSGDIAGLREALANLEAEKAALAETVASLEQREVPEPQDYSGELSELRAGIETLVGQQVPLAQRIADLESRELPEVVDYSNELAELRESLAEVKQQKAALADALSGDLAGLSESLAELKSQKAALADALAKLESRELPEPVDYSGDLNELRSSLAALSEQQSQLGEALRSVEAREIPAPTDYSGELENLRVLIETLNEQQAPLVKRIGELEARPVASDNSADVAQIHAALGQLQQQTSQVNDRLANFAEQQQISKLMEMLSELQMRLARNSEQLVELEKARSQGADEQRKQLENQLDIQERQRALLEEIQIKLEIQEEQLTKQQAELAELVAQAKEAAETRRRASDEPHRDPTMGALIESALHIERGEYAEAVRCLEAARQLGDNPKIDQALALARKMLEQQKG